MILPTAHDAPTGDAGRSPGGQAGEITGAGEEILRNPDEPVMIGRRRVGETSCPLGPRPRVIQVNPGAPTSGSSTGLCIIR